MRLKGGILPLDKWWSVSNIAIRLDMQWQDILLTTRQGVQMVEEAPCRIMAKLSSDEMVVVVFLRDEDGFRDMGLCWRGKRSVSLLFAPTLNRIWHTCKWKYAFNGWSNWRFNSPDKGMGCVEFVQMILKRHTPENSLYSQQLLSSCRCACVVMNIIEFNEFYLLWRIGFRKGSSDDGGWGWSLGHSRESVH